MRRHIRTVAGENGDRLVDTISQAGPDHLHPGADGYRQIAKWTEQGNPSSTARAPAAPLRRLAGLPPATPAPGAIYGAWPVTVGPFAAIPPRDYAFRASGRGFAN